MVLTTFWHIKADNTSPKYTWHTPTVAHRATHYSSALCGVKCSNPPLLAGARIRRTKFDAAMERLSFFFCECLSLFKRETHFCYTFDNNQKLKVEN